MMFGVKNPKLFYLSSEIYTFIMNGNRNDRNKRATKM